MASTEWSKKPVPALQTQSVSTRAAAVSLTDHDKNVRFNHEHIC